MALVAVKSDRVELRAPFHPGLPYRCRALGGQWKGSEVGWVFGRDHEDALRSICFELFGVDGHEESQRDVVDVQVTVDERAISRQVFETYGRAIAILGRDIAVPVPNRQVARPGRGVKFLKGRPFCRVGVDFYMLSIPNGSVFIIQGVPRMTVDPFRISIEDAGSLCLV